MSFIPIAPLYGAQVTDLESFNNSSSWEGVALLTEMVASFVMSQAARFANWIEGLIENWTSQSEPIPIVSKDLSLGDFIDDFAIGDEDSDAQKIVEVKTAIKNIKSRDQITSGTTSTYMNDLATSSFIPATFIDRLIFTTIKTSETFVENKIAPQVNQARAQKNEFVFIPVVFQSMIEPHIVLFTVNIRENVIEYYDPKGDGIGNQEILALENMNVQQFANKLKTELGISKIQTSKASHQEFFDGKNCGRYVMNFMKQRLESDSFEGAIHSVKGLSEIKKDLLEHLTFSLEMLA